MNATLSFTYCTLSRHRRLIIVTTVLAILVGLAIFQLTPRLYYSSVHIPFPSQFHPEDAVSDAERDIHCGHFRFYHTGGIVSSAPGVPESVANHYPRGIAGTDLGCSGSTQEQQEYARRYNQRMLRYLRQ